MKCGFKIGGGIDQDYRKSPQGYTDNVSSGLLKISGIHDTTLRWEKVALKPTDPDILGLGC